MSLLRRVARAGSLQGVVLLLLAWELVARAFDLAWLPPASSVLDRTIELLRDPEVRADMGRSLRNLLVGLTISLVAGIAMGAAMAVWRPIRYALEPYVNAMLMAPQLVFAPIFFVVFGLSANSIVALVVIYALFVIASNTLEGMLAVDLRLHDMARSFGASRWQTVRSVVLPESMPMVIAGIRLGTGRAVKGMINGEMFIASVGLGARLTGYGGRFDAEGVLGVTVLVVIIALGVNAAVELADRRLAGWAHSGSA